MLAPAIRSILNDAGLSPRDIDAVICGRGPGSFTGLRIGMAAAKGMAAALGIPMVSVPTLDAIAQTGEALPGVRLALLDARKDRFYCAAYRDGERLLGDSDLGAEDIADLSRQWLSAGEHLYLCGPHGSELLRRWEPMSDSPKAVYPGFREWISAMLDLGTGALSRGEADTDEQGPEYLRVSEAELGITRPGS
jgi:tRNA threonylcarbamoyladenosine biosynthesis protein TsaB